VLVPFVLLAVAVLSLWAGGSANSAAWRRNLWLIVGAASVVAALVFGVVKPLGLLWIITLAAAVRTYFARPSLSRWSRLGLAAVIVLLAAGLMLHRLPGFHNLRVIDAVRFTPDAVPFTLYLNFDKTLLGLVLLGWGHARLTSMRGARTMLTQAAPWAAGLFTLVMALSLAAGYVRWAPKIPPQSALWLAVNLGFTCLAEEALFRGFIQEQLQQLWAERPSGRWLALTVAAVLFGLAHVAGGPAYVALAMVSGAGYGWIYQRTGKIEASLLTHFALNTVHFFLFTYPALA